MRRAALPLVLLLLAAPAAAEVFPVAWGLQVQPLPVPRTDLGAANMGEFFVFIGGDAPSEDGYGTRVDVYDAFAQSWVQEHVLPPLPVALHDAAVVAMGPDLLVIGGALHGAQGSQIVSPATWILDTRLPIALRAWVPFTPLPFPVQHAMVATDTFTHLWVFGGAGQDGLPTAHAWQMGSLGDGTPDGVWLPLADMPTPRAWGGAVQFSNQEVFLVGGESGVLTPTDAVDVLDVATGAWSQAAPLPLPREDLAVFRSGGGIYAVGGRTPTFASATVQFFDQETRAWVQLPDMPHEQWGMASVGFLDDMYLFGGHDAVGDPTRMAQRAHVDEGLP
jgi:hypothetical protein